MAIFNYNDVDGGLLEEIQKAGYQVREIDGVMTSTNDVAVQAIIDSYDPLPYAKKLKRAELRTEYRNRLILIYPDAEEMTESHFDVVIDIGFDVFRSVINASRSPNADWQNVIDTRQARRAARNDINALLTVEDIRAYDVVNTPAWPVI